MKGIDVSHWNGWPFNAATVDGYKQADFVVVKATQGVSYSYVSYFAKSISKANKDGKLLGAYHYAAGGDAVKEADYFVATVKPYIGKAVLALDWERGGNRAWGSKTWARKFVDRVHSKTGVWPMIYTGVEGCVHCASCAKDCALWFAGYPTGAASWTVPTWPSRYKISPWKAYTIWQFTSGGGLDRNVTALTADKWAALAGSKKPQESAGAKKETQTGKSSAKSKQGYSGAFPTLPQRGYYKFNDGIRVLVSRRNDIKNVQKLVNWITGEKLDVDGKYGAHTELAVRAAQKMLGMKADGLFGPATLGAAKLFRK